MSDQISCAQFQEAKLKQALKHFNDRIGFERLLAVRLQKCMELLFDKCNKIAGQIGDPIMSCDLKDQTLRIAAYDRILTFIPVKRAASDSKLPQPRGLYCCQVLLFGHLDGQEEGSLLTAFRVYPDGLCSDGESVWKLDEESIEFAQYVTDVIADHLFASDLFWPAPDAMPDFVRTIPVQENIAQSDRLKDNCIGFECELGSKYAAITTESDGQ